MIWILNLVGYGKKFVFGRKNTTPEDHFQFGSDYITHSAARFSFMKKQYVDNPKIMVAGPSNAWPPQGLRGA